MLKEVSVQIPVKRIYGFDLLRTLSFVVIASHHFGMEVWEEPIFSPFRESSSFWYYLEEFCRLFTFTGQTVLLLSAFLITLTAQKNEKVFKIVPIMLILWTISCYFDYEPEAYFFVWDVFPLIACGMLVTSLIIQYFAQSRFILPILGFLILCFPFWKYEWLNSLSLYPRHILVGDCATLMSDWPILPWIGIVFLGCGLGLLIKSRFEFFKKIQKFEILLWLILISWTPTYWSIYTRLEVGVSMPCEGYRQEPIVFFSVLLPFLFLMRLSLVEKINLFLSQGSLVRWISNLEINKNFGIAYFVHFITIAIFIKLGGISILEDPLVSGVFVILVLPVTEMILRTFKVLLKKKRGVSGGV